MLAGWHLPAAAFAAETSARPNFLFIITDDQRWDALGVVQREQGERGRFPWFTTTHMDRLAAEGARFRNAFTTLSLCSPSRAAFLTGRYNHLNGIANNITPFPPDAVTHATLLRAAGYETAMFGKWHMGDQRERPGFDHVATYVSHGQYFDCPFLVNGEQKKTAGWVDDVVTDFTVDYLKQKRAKPFSIFLGYKSPHAEWKPAPRFAERYKDDAPRPVPNLDVAPGYRKAGGYPEHDLEMQRRYFRCLAGVDENLGRILQTLDETGLAANTVVIYTSDNGVYLGEHSLGDKRSAYEESIRIPLLVRWPGRVKAGAVIDEMALNVDLAPTLLELAGVAVPAEMQGRSWRPLLERTDAAPRPWRTSFLYEYFLERRHSHTPTMTATRTGTAKLIQYAGREEQTELFDLNADPYETRNLVSDPAARDLLAQMRAEYDRLVQETGYRIPDYADTPPPPKPAPAAP